MSDWTSFHVFCHADAQVTERLLLEVVKPAVDELVARGRLHAWFFIRYWEGGPHLRLRLRDLDEADAANLRDTLERGARALPPTATALTAASYYAAHAAGHPDPVAAFGWYEDRQVVALPYEPEVDRYGGPRGLALSEELFCTSSALALAGLRVAPFGPRRAALAVDLLLALFAGLGLDDLEAVTWLRRTVNLWPQLVALPPARVASICRGAEQTYLDRPDVWRARREAVARASTEGKPCLPTYWAAQIAASWARFRQAEQLGELELPPLEILRSIVHMFHNRLGLTILEECHVEWLVALVLEQARPLGLLGDDGTGAADRRYHAQSKLSAAVPPTPFGGTTLDAGPARRWPAAARRALTSELPPIDGLRALATTVAARQSHLGGFEGELGEPELAALLRLTAGHGLAPRSPRRHPLSVAYPAAGAIASIELYVLVRKVVGVTPGLYVYDGAAHALERVGRGPEPAALLASSPTLDGTGASTVAAADAALWIFPVAHLTEKRKKYGMRAYRFAALEGGHATQNLVLVAATLGLASISIGGFFDDHVSQLLGLDGVHQFPLYMIPLGRPAKASRAAIPEGALP